MDTMFEVTIILSSNRADAFLEVGEVILSRCDDREFQIGPFD